MFNSIKTIGWDIGGAHLKAVLLDANGDVLNALQMPCELWRGLDKLEAAISEVLGVLKIDADAQHAVTMTGELVDLFPNRHEGVMEISNLVSNMFGKQTKFYASGTGFVTIGSVLKHTGSIASANWHASASMLANYVPDALLVDIGSTTTDIIPMIGGKVAVAGYSDAQRMKNDTLVYTGVVRTPVMALAQKLLFEGVEINVAAEYFATMADVYRLTGDLTSDADMMETADGKGKAPLESARRLARMVGHDADDKPLETWKQLASFCKTKHIEQIRAAVLKHLKAGMPMIGAGSGAFLVEMIASELEHPYMTISQVLKTDLGENLSVCFPAYAVAHLYILHVSSGKHLINVAD